MGVFELNKENGFSMADVLLSLLIWSLCGLFFVPLYSDLRQSLVEAKQQVHVVEAMQYGARNLVVTGAVRGSVKIDTMMYHYRIMDTHVCVHYYMEYEEYERCENIDMTTALH